MLKVAESGDAQAQNNIANMYKRGEVGDIDYNKAKYWLQKSAEQNYAPAQYNLGAFYYNGQGVTKNYTLAKKWFKKACEQHEKDSCESYQELEKSGY